MSPRRKRVTVRAYNLRPGDVQVSTNSIIESVMHYPGTWATAFTDVALRNVCVDSTYIHTYDADALVTVTRTYA